METSKALCTSETKRFQHYKTSFTTNARGTSLDRTHNRKDLQKQTQNNKVNANGIIHIKNSLNINELNVPTKRHSLAEWTQKQDSYICSLQETHFRARDPCRLKVRDWKKIFHANGSQKKESSDTQIKLTLKIITKDNEGHYIMIKGSIQEEDITIIYAQEHLKC